MSVDDAGSAGGGPPARRALVVDDDPALANLLAEALNTIGWGVERFTDPAKAMKRLAEQAFDVVLTDLAMTDVSGMDILKEAKARAPSTQVVVISGFGTIELAVEAMKRGAADFITKPFTIRDVRAKVESLAAPGGPAAGVSPRPGGPAAQPQDGRGLRSAEKAAILDALERNRWNMARAARELGISRSTLYCKIERHGIQRPADQSPS